MVASRTKNGNRQSLSSSYMNAFSGALVANMADPSDIWPGTLYSWSYYPSFNSNVLPGPPNSPTFSGTCTAGSAVVTGIADTSILTVGQPMTGTGIIGGNQLNNYTPISTIDSSSQITLSLPAVVSGAHRRYPSIQPHPAWSHSISLDGTSATPQSPASPGRRPGKSTARTTFSTLDLTGLGHSLMSRPRPVEGMTTGCLSLRA